MERPSGSFKAVQLMCGASPYIATDFASNLTVGSLQCEYKVYTPLRFVPEKFCAEYLTVLTAGWRSQFGTGQDDTFM